MPFQTDDAQRARDAGLRVVEVAGWRNRGNPNFHPRGGVCHHTAGSSHGTAPSLSGVINGHHGSAPGPLANALQSREPDGNDIFYIVAAGRANHAGKGGWRGLSGNSTVHGLEIEHNGVTPLSIGRQRLAARYFAAMANGRYGAPMVCQHREWAPNRKIDAATHVDPTVFRTWVAESMGGRPPKPQPPKPIPPPPPDLVTTLELEMFGLLVNDNGKKQYKTLWGGGTADCTPEVYMRLAGWVKMPHYEGADGKGIHPLEFIAIAKSLGAWNVPAK